MQYNFYKFEIVFKHKAIKMKQGTMDIKINVFFKTFYVGVETGGFL